MDLLGALRVHRREMETVGGRWKYSCGKSTVLEIAHHAKRYLKYFNCILSCKYIYAYYIKTGFKVYANT